MAWNLHIVGDKVLEEVDTIAAAILKAVEDAGHSVISAVLTTDLGPKDITPPPTPVEPVVQTPVDTAPEAPPAESVAPVQTPADTPPVDTTPPADPSVPTDTPPAAPVA